MTVTKSCPWLVLLGSGYSLGIYFIINFQYKLSEANLLLLSQNWGEKTQGISNRNKNFFYTFLSEFSDAHPSTFFWLVRRKSKDIICLLFSKYTDLYQWQISTQTISHQNENTRQLICSSGKWRSRSLGEVW